MTLKDKLQVEIMDLPIMDEVIDDIGTNLEYVVDNFAIEFAEWAYINEYNIGYYFNSSNTKELLETYKKEKGL